MDNKWAIRSDDRLIYRPSQYSVIVIAIILHRQFPKFFSGEPARGLGLAGSNLLKNRPVNQKPNVVVIVAVVIAS